ncbi:MAG: hypothetical protein K6G40_08895 [Eubacterium sp.]|nr:hypothetical protein [Eubacterium sp.]
MSEAYCLPGICGAYLSFQITYFSAIFVALITAVWLGALAFSSDYLKGEENKGRYYRYFALTYIAVVGIFFSADFFTTFIFFEIMSLASYVWVATRETDEALRAGNVYLAIGIIGGMVMLMGVFILFAELKTLDFSEMYAATEGVSKAKLYAAGGCLMFGFGAKAGAFPLHIWLPSSYKEAPSPLTALLSGVLSKAGLFGIIVCCSKIFWGDEKWSAFVLIIALFTMAIGGIGAMFSADMKVTVAYSSMSQIGFILVGAAAMCFSSDAALEGVGLHMINHMLIKFLLFTLTGIVIMNVGSGDLNRVRGYGRKKLLLGVPFLIGGLAVSGVPFFSGYISKTLLHEALLGLPFGMFNKAAEYFFLMCGGMTLCYMTKIYVCVFIEENEDEALQKAYDEGKLRGKLSAAVCILFAAVILGIGIVYPIVKQTVPYYSLEILKGSFISIAFGIVFYAAFVRKILIRHGRYEKLSLRLPRLLKIYEFLIMDILLRAIGWVSEILDSVTDNAAGLLRATVYKDSHQAATLPLRKRIRKKLGDAAVENMTIIEKSIAYGFMMAGIGVILTMLYIVLM